jgi:GntR family transcriptional regulator
MTTDARKTSQRRDEEAKEVLQVTPVERDSPIPVYVQVEQDLRRLSRSGSAVKIPSEVDLAALYGVSRVTMRQSLQRLAAAGLVKREHGRGTTLVPRPDVALDLGLFRSVTDQLREAGHKGRVKMLHRALAPAPKEVAETLHLKTREKAIVLKRLVLANDVPLSVNTSWFPAKLAPGMQKVQLEDASVWSYLADTYSLVVSSAENKIEVVESGVAESEALQLDYATPLIKLSTCFHDKLGRPVEYSVSLWRSAQLRFSFSQSLP